MGSELYLGLALAIASAVATNFAFLMKHRGALAAPDVDVRRPVRSAVDLFRSRWWTIGWLVALVAFLLHVGALGLAPLSLTQAVIAGGLVVLAVLAERCFGFQLETRQRWGIALVAVGVAFLAVTTSADQDHTSYRVAGMVAVEAGLVAVGLLLVMCSARVRRLSDRRGVLLGAAAGLLWGVSSIAIKALTGTVPGDLLALVTPWTLAALLAGVGGFYASARSLQIGEGIAVITVTSAAANLSAIVGGILVFGDSLGSDALEVVARLAAFGLILAALALMPAPFRAAGARAG